MRIESIYKQYQIMPNLQMHMLRAAAVGNIIFDKWIDKAMLNIDTIVTTLLLHDMGNIIKFELDRFPNFLGKEQKRLDHWKKIQQSYFEKYGYDEHSATFLIAKEIGIPHYIQEVLENMGSTHLSKVVQDSDYNCKISLYADMRVAPQGVVSVNKRFDDLLQRYKGRNHPVANKDKTGKNRQFCLEVEQQLQKRVDLDLNSITDRMIEPYIEQVRNYTVQTVSTSSI